PGLGETMVTVAPASLSAFTGSVSSGSSNPSVARTATRKPVNSDMMFLLVRARPVGRHNGGPRPASPPPPPSLGHREGWTQEVCQCVAARFDGPWVRGTMEGCDRLGLNVANRRAGW